MGQHSYYYPAVRTIASRDVCTSSDIVKFLDCLRDLVKYCNFDVNSTTDEENNDYKPLLLRAASKDNSILVTKLLCEFNASYKICDPSTGENLLHICFKRASKLRFYFVLEYPSLLHQSDDCGDLPLFIACKQNDVVFFEWLFEKFKGSNTGDIKSVYEARKSKTESFDQKLQGIDSMEGVIPSAEFPSRSSISSEVGLSRRHKSFLLLLENEKLAEHEKEDVFGESLIVFDDYSIPDSPTIGEVINMKLYSTNTYGNSILHILTEKGSVDILAIFRRICGVIAKFDLSALCVCYKGQFPIENALAAGNLACVRVIIDLSIYSCHYSALLQEKSILKASVVTKNVENVKILIRFGFHANLELAVTLASSYRLEEVLRILLFWRTQIQSYSEVSERHLLNIDCHDYTKKVLSWQELELQHVSPTWISDTINAMSITNKLISEMSPTDEDNEYYLLMRLGEECLKYFENDTVALPPALTDCTYHHKIVKINLSENLLERVPEELFQLASLNNLDLRYNKITALPSSEDLMSNFYSSNMKMLLLDHNQLTYLPDDMIWGLANSLTNLSIVQNKLESIPPGLWAMPNLSILRLARNNLSNLHYFSDLELHRAKSLAEEFSLFRVGIDGVLIHPDTLDQVEVRKTAVKIKRLAALSHTLAIIRNPEAKFSTEVFLREVILMRELEMAPHSGLINDNTPANILSPFFSSCSPDLSTNKGNIVCSSKLQYLDLSNNNFKSVPWNLPCLAPNLTSLDMTSNLISGLDIVHDFPRKISNLSLEGNKIKSLCQVRLQDLPCGQLTSLFSACDKKRFTLYCNHSRHEVLEHLTRLILNNNVVNYFPILKRFRGDSDVDIESSGSQAYPLYPNLSTLSLVSNCLISIPRNLHFIKHLGSIDFSKNGKICELPEDMGLMNTEFITRIGLDGIHPKNVPNKVVNSSAMKLVKYLKNIKQRAKPYRHIKLMLVGEANKGKTSLLLNLIKKGKMRHFNVVNKGFNGIPLATVGVDLGEYEYSPSGQPPVKFMTWDFGGQASLFELLPHEMEEEYYATHQCFLTKRSLYLLLWNIQDGEKGLKSLQYWLENIGSCAPQTPVIVIGTHLDLINQKEREKITSDLEAKFKEMYISSSREITCIYPSIVKKCYFIDIHNPKQVDQLRDDIYTHVIEFKSKYFNDANMLLDELIPESYVTLQNFVRDLADKCAVEGRLPIYTRSDLMKELTEAGHNYEEELEDATSFLHENGILLNYDDSSFLADLYFIDPQWLCQMLAKLITIRHTNPYCNKGSMWIEDVKKIYPIYSNEFVNLLKKFEVAHKLDNKRVLIPSLLPDTEEDTCIIYPSTILNLLVDADNLNFSAPANYDQTNYQIYCRYYLLPFVPNGFFTRLIARLMSSNIIDHLYSSLVSDLLESVHVSNAIHWRCWRNGIVIVWNHKEIFRVAPLTGEMSSSDIKIVLMTKQNSQELVNTLKGLEIKIAVIPESKIQVCTFLEPALERMKEQKSGVDNSYMENGFKGRSIASWLLHTATSMIDSVFNDWYEGFAFRQGYNEKAINLKWTNYCSHCVTSVNQSLPDLRTNRVFMFTSTYCCLAQSRGENLKCPNHGSIKVEDVAPDLAFCDFHPANVFRDHSTFELTTSSHPLGKGGFGSVHKADLHKKPFDKFAPVQVAQKLVSTDHDKLDAKDSDILDQLNAWHTYDRASLEARVMNKLYHKHILDFIGICFLPELSILIELAPKGDLKSVLKSFKTENIRLSRKTIKTTLIQVAEAMEYLHSLNIIYRDLKPQNILVWKYPLPKQQWNTNAPIHIKVADYGISLEVSPQGICGYQGSEPYLPPEVVIYGGRKTYSTQLDVYGFGMCIYYLISLQTPFSNDHIPVALREGKRPELTHKLQSHSVFITELMYWCWSELPRDRPNFSQILQILRNDSFTNLLATAQLTVDSNSRITAACTHTLIAQELTDTIHKEMCPSVTKIMSLVYRKTKNNDHAVQVWYGTDSGHCELIQFQPSGTIRKTINLSSNFKGYISSIKSIAGLIWISTIGNGLHVYDSSTYKYKCSWGESEEEQVYSLVNVEEKKLVLALTSKGIYSFHSDITEDQFFDRLEHLKHLEEEFGGQGVNVGVVVPSSRRNSITCQVWVCSHKEHKFYILNPEDLKVTAVVECTKIELSSIVETTMKKEQSNFNSTKKLMDKPLIASMTTNIKDLQLLRMHHMKLAVANNWMVPLWDVEERKVEHVFDCKDYCKTHYHDSHIPGHGVRITSLLAKEDILSIGLEGGIVLSLNCTNMSILLTFHAYDRSVYSLMLMNPLPAHNPKTEIQPVQSETSTIPSRVASILPNPGTPPRKKPPQSLYLRPITSDMKGYLTPIGHGGRNKFMKNQSVSVETPLLLISIGRGYRGVVGSNQNHPSKFILPNTHENQSQTRLVKPGVSTSHLLIWSTEESGGDDGFRQAMRKKSREEKVVFDVIEQTDKALVDR